MTDVHVLGVRHHGPGSARAVAEALDELRPDLVLVEGPPELDALTGLVADPGIPNHIVPINRLSAWWREATSTNWLLSRTLDQLKAMKRDFAPVAGIMGQIDLAIERLSQGRLL